MKLTRAATRNAKEAAVASRSIPPDPADATTNIEPDVGTPDAAEPWRAGMRPHDPSRKILAAWAIAVVVLVAVLVIVA